MFDPKLCADFISLSNKATFKTRYKTENLRQILLMIGQKEILNVVMLAFISTKKTIKHPIIDEIIVHSIKTGIACKHVTKMLKGYTDKIQDSLSFLIGLIHDIGILLLIEEKQNEYINILDQIKIINPVPIYSLLNYENDIIFKNHAEHGADFLNKHNFNKFICEAVLNHHVIPTKNSGLLNIALYISNCLTIEIDTYNNFQSYFENIEKKYSEVLLYLDEVKIKQIKNIIQTEYFNYIDFLTR